MSDTTEILAAWQAKTDAAAEGPWENDGPNVTQATGEYLDITPARVSCMSYCYGGSPEPMAEADREFIAAARTAMPALLLAVKNVLALHTKQIDTPVVFGANFCHHCGYDYPCPTVRTITDALNGEQA